jgi:hypothetical protein
MDNEYVDCPQFSHAPLRLPREGVIGEQVFARRWAKLMELDVDSPYPPNPELASVLENFGGEINQRHATVAASMICWLGTNLGYSFLGTAKLLAKSQTFKRDSYLMAWSVQNSRKVWFNGGVRTLEYCLTPDGVKPGNGPDLTAADLEVADNVALWLGAQDGQEFVEACQAEIKQRENETSLGHYLENNLNMAIPAADLGV